jgi:hypothetical protein
MSALSRSGSKLRAFALVAGAAYAVHQLRYLLAYGGGSGGQLSVQAHGYLALVLPLLAVFGLVALAAFVASLVEAGRREPEPDCLPGGGTLWVRSAGLLFALYSVQEWFEGLVGHGHESGLGAIFAHGGWWAIPLALAFGALVAWLQKGAATALEVVAARSRSRSRRRVAASAARTGRESPAQKPLLDVVASFLAGRGPPLAST